MLSIRLLSAVLLIGLVSLGAAEPPAQAGTRFPPVLDSYLTKVVRLVPADRERLLAGTAVTKLLDGDDRKEVAVFGAVWIAAPVHRYLEAVKDIESFERGGGFNVTKRLSTPPRLDDFAALHLPPDDLEDMRACRVGSCVMKLSEHAIEQFRAGVNWRAPDAKAKADAVMQRIALEYATSYLDGGNTRLPVYRDVARPTVVADEFRAMLDRMPELTSLLPNVRTYLLDYPKATLPDSTSFLYWQETEFGLRPTIRISHMTVRESPDETFVLSKMVYGSHYFWTAVELRAIVPDPARGAGFWLATISRTRLDGLDGFTGFFVRRKVRSGARDGTLKTLQVSKTKAEGRAEPAR